MALISFGATFRTASPAFALTNTTSTNIYLDVLGINLKGLGTQVINLDVWDAYIRNPRHPQVWDITTKNKPYKDDLASLTALIAAGTLIVKSTTYSASANTYTVGASANPTVAGSSLFFA